MKVGLAQLPSAFNMEGIAGVPQDRCQDRCDLSVLLGEDPAG